MSLLPPENAQCLQIVLWRNLANSGSDYCALYLLPKAWLLKGTAIAALDAVDPVLVHYEIACDAGWNTRQVEVQCAHGATHQQLKLQADSGIWRRDGQLLPDVNGCLDVDISITPATNTLPIRRLQFATGVSQEVTAAWIKIPELTVEPLAQRYTKIDHYQYQYESSNNFIAKLEVDDQSMIVRYADLWQRLALYK
jgi:uncharacterized protein